MSRGINKAILIGMLGNNPEVKYTLSGKAVTNFSLEVQEEWGKEENQQHTEWFDVEARGKGAELMGQYLHHGDYVYLEGILRTDRWEKDGITYYTTKVVVQDCRFLAQNSGDSAGSTVDDDTEVADE